MESILVTVRTGLGVAEEYDGFDTELILGINTSIMSLTQLGIGPEDGLVVTGINETWEDLFNSVTNIEAVKSYILLKTRLEFDPPTSSFLLTALNDQLAELSWRIMVQVDPEPVEV